LYLFRYAKDRENEQQLKTAEFRAAKKVEEEALMAALGIKVMPPPGLLLLFLLINIDL
jgi:hypothetical protein